MTARSKARARAVAVLYEADQHGLSGRRVDLLDLLADRKERTTAQTTLPTYAIEVVEGVAAHSAEIDDLIAAHSQGWTLARMPAVDRAILRLASWELCYNDDVPPGVVMSEAVKLARQLSTEESPTFINGVLGSIDAFGPSDQP